MTAPYPETAAEALAIWDRGESQFSIEMGGLGPGYEQVIHVACFEVIRDMLNEPLPPDGDKVAWEAWNKKADVALHRADKFPGMGMSGAQAGAAKSIAINFLRDGPRKCFEDLKANNPKRAEDMIQVCRAWPRPPEVKL